MEIRICRRLTAYIRRVRQDFVGLGSEAEIDAARKKWVEPFNRICDMVRENPILAMDLILERVLTMRRLAREADERARHARELLTIWRSPELS